jgi:xanthine dehydrogenase accessory factor
MSDLFFAKVQELIEQNTPFAMAIVVRAEKPTSGKPGDKAVITADGTMVGWIGGSCSQPTVIREALKALQEGKSRFIRLSPDPAKLTPQEGLIDFPMTCFSGGTLEIYIEPQYPQPRLLIVGGLPVAQALAALGRVLNYDVIMVDPDRTGDGNLTTLEGIQQQIRPDTYVVVATHGSYDEVALEHVLKARPRYVGLVASRKRLQAVLDYLRVQGVAEEDLQRIKAPAGLDIGAHRGDEIAVSILAEIIQRRRSTPADDWSAPEPAPAMQIALQAIPLAVPEAAASETPAKPEPAAPEVGKPEPAALIAPGIAIDLVCGMEVEIASARFTYEYEGKTYYFCAPGCKLAFRRDPESFLHPKVAIDPVCGMEVDTASAQHSSEYRAKTYYFCSAGCKATFDEHPEAYAIAMHHH